jgi:glucose dehydrogenase
MGCPCTDPKTGEIKIVPAKTKEMVYWAQNPTIIDAIEQEKKMGWICPAPTLHAGGKK